MLWNAWDGAEQSQPGGVGQLGGIFLGCLTCDKKGPPRDISMRAMRTKPESTLNLCNSFAGFTETDDEEQEAEEMIAPPMAMYWQSVEELEMEKEEAQRKAGQNRVIATPGMVELACGSVGAPEPSE